MEHSGLKEQYWFKLSPVLKVKEYRKYSSFLVKVGRIKKLGASTTHDLSV